MHTNKVDTEINQGGTISSDVTHKDDAMVKEAARPEISNNTGTGTKKITQGGLNNP